MYLTRCFLFQQKTNTIRSAICDAICRFPTDGKKLFFPQRDARWIALGCQSRRVRCPVGLRLASECEATGR